MFPVEVSALAAGGAGAGRQAAGDAAGTMLPPFFMGSIWPATAGAAGSEEDEAAAAAAAHDRALAASRNHREAEKRRRERIKSHLDRLRNVLACDPKAYILRSISSNLPVAYLLLKLNKKTGPLLCILYIFNFCMRFT